MNDEERTASSKCRNASYRQRLKILNSKLHVFLLPFVQTVYWLGKKNGYILCFVKLKKNPLPEITNQGSDYSTASL